MKVLAFISDEDLAREKRKKVAEVESRASDD